MQLDALVATGHAPWLPTRDAKGELVLHYYDIPLAGTFNVHGHSVAFLCMSGPDGEVTLWAYVPISAEHRDILALRKSESAEDVQDAVADLFVGREAVFAIADGERIARWTRHVVGDHVSRAARDAVITLTSESESREERESAAREARTLLTLG